MRPFPKVGKQHTSRPEIPKLLMTYVAQARKEVGAEAEAK